MGLVYYMFSFKVRNLICIFIFLLCVWRIGQSISFVAFQFWNLKFHSRFSIILWVIVLLIDIGENAWRSTYFG